MKIRDLLSEIPYQQHKVWPLEVEKLLNTDIDIMSDWGRAESLISQAIGQFPESVELKVAYYKMLAYSNRLEEAMSVIQDVLKKTESGLDALPANIGEMEETSRVHLYTLKALAFVSLKMENITAAQKVLDHLEQLDPSDQVGASVVRDLANSFAEAAE
ncbi:MAG: hypothetical protein ACPGYX_03880 [Oceanobacter sp.]